MLEINMPRIETPRTPKYDAVACNPSSDHSTSRNKMIMRPIQTIPAETRCHAKKKNLARRPQEADGHYHESNNSAADRDPPPPPLLIHNELAFQLLGNGDGRFYAFVEPAKFRMHKLVFKNDELLANLGISYCNDQQLVNAFGKFQLALTKPEARPMAMRYHGFQFGRYNPEIGDGRGFLLLQLRAAPVHPCHHCSLSTIYAISNSNQTPVATKLYDLAGKGTGTTPFSRGFDGCMTLKEGLREILASEFFKRVGLPTSRVLTVIETGEALIRDDDDDEDGDAENADDGHEVALPARSCVMIRVCESHIRFGTLERPYYENKLDELKQLTDHLIETYYPEIIQCKDNKNNKYELFYEEVVRRTARMAAYWMAYGFVHGVLNTDNMLCTGESFDYGPFTFLPGPLDYNFVSAAFDERGRFSFGKQPLTCHWNLQMLLKPIAALPGVSAHALNVALARYYDEYNTTFNKIILNRLGLDDDDDDDEDHDLMKNSDVSLADLVRVTIRMLLESKTRYNEFFKQIRHRFTESWCLGDDHHDDVQAELRIESDLTAAIPSLTASTNGDFVAWRRMYRRALVVAASRGGHAAEKIRKRMQRASPLCYPDSNELERLWSHIRNRDDWSPLGEFLKELAR